MNEALMAKEVEGAEYVDGEDRPYVPPPGAKVEHGIQNIDAHTNLQVLRQEGVHRNPETGQLEPRKVAHIIRTRIKHLPGKTAEEKRARVRIAREKTYATSAKQNRELLRNSGQLPSNTTGSYRDSQGNLIKGTPLNQYNENWDDVQAIAQLQDQNPAKYENQAVDQSEDAPLAGNAEDEFINQDATKAKLETVSEVETRVAENERKGQLHDKVYRRLSRNDKQVFDALAQGMTARQITARLFYTTAQIASCKRRLAGIEREVLAETAALPKMAARIIR